MVSRASRHGKDMETTIMMKRLQGLGWILSIDGMESMRPTCKIVGDHTLNLKPQTAWLLYHLASRPLAGLECCGGPSILHDPSTLYLRN